MTGVAGLFLRTADATVDFVDSCGVDQAWSEPSVLHGYTIGALTAHLSRAITNVEAYLDEPAPDGAATIDAPTYFATALADHDPRDSAFHVAVRQRAVAAGEQGWRVVRDEMADATRRLRGVDLAEHPPIRVLDGIAMAVDDYLRTRLVELCVHCTDLADSLGCNPPDLPGQAWSEVARVVAETAILRNGPMAFALGASRPDRFGPTAAF